MNTDERISFKTPFATLLPAPSDEELAALEASLAEHGQREPVLVDEENNVLDGHNRLRFLKDPEVRVVAGLSPAEKEALVVECNTSRRNLSPEQRRQVRETQKRIAAELRAEDAKKWTQAKIARRLGTDQATVSRWLESTSNMQSHNACIPEPDARRKVVEEAEEEIVVRVEDGEKQGEVAASAGVSQQRVSQIVKKHKEKKAAAKRPGADRPTAAATGERREPAVRSARRGVGMDRAIEVTNLLHSIPLDDPERNDGFTFVARWIEDHRTEKADKAERRGRSTAVLPRAIRGKRLEDAREVERELAQSMAESDLMTWPVNKLRRLVKRLHDLLSGGNTKGGGSRPRRPRL